MCTYRHQNAVTQRLPSQFNFHLDESGALYCSENLISMCRVKLSHKEVDQFAVVHESACTLRHQLYARLICCEMD
jgi:hypothetical protein